MKNPNSFTFNFKKFLFRIIIPVSVCIFIVGQLLNYAFEKFVILNSQVGGVSKVNRILIKTSLNEIPILGSSRAEGSFIPELLGDQYFNYGISGTQDDVTIFFLEEELKKKKETPVLVNFDLDGINFGLGDVGNYLYNSKNAEVQRLLGDHNNILYSVPFLKYHGKFESYVKYFLNEKLNLTKYTNKGGSFELNVLPAKKFDELVKEREAATTIFNNNLLLTENLCALLAKTTRPIVFVIAPYHKSFFKNYRNRADAEKFLHNLAEYPNVRIINFSKVDYPDSLYLNTTHLNYLGAKIFTQQLKDSLKQDIKPFYLNL